MDQTSMGLSSEAADANAAAGFELTAETFYSENKEESTATTLLLRRHYNDSITGKVPLVQGQRVRL